MIRIKNLKKLSFFMQLKRLNIYRVFSINQFDHFTHYGQHDLHSLSHTQGRKDQALNLLRLHSDLGPSSDAFSSLDELVRKMPALGVAQSASASDFDFRWRHWKREVVAR